MTGDKNGNEKPAGAWTAQETVLYMVRTDSRPQHTPFGSADHRGSQLDYVRQGKFYILVPDNETRREIDQLRIMWNAGDLVEGRPALSRWHKDYKALFEDYMREGLAQLE